MVMVSPLTCVRYVGPDKVGVTKVDSNTVRCEESPGEQDGGDLINNIILLKVRTDELRSYQGQVLWMS